MITPVHLPTHPATESQCWDQTPEGIAWATQAAAEQRKQARADAEDHAAMEKAMAGHVRCDNCLGTGFDAEPDGFGGSVGGPCSVCHGSGWVPAPT